MFNTNTNTQNQIEDAKELWSWVQDVSKFKSGGSSMSLRPLREIVSTVQSRPFLRNQEPRKEVILTAQFIANIEPSYINSEGQYILLKQLRGLAHTEDDVKFLCEKIEGIVKPYISVTKETAIVGGKLRIQTKMTKKKLIHSAVRHLLMGTEVIDDPRYYFELLYYSVFPRAMKESYAYLVGMALGLNYPSVHAMMKDFCLTFVDQTENVLRNGTAVLYDGAIKTEKL